MIPIMKKKTVALFIDDDKDFLDDICDFLPQTHFFHKFENPMEALSIVKNPMVTMPELENEKSIKTFPFHRIRNLFNEFSTFEFHKIVSVVVVDYRMTPINGIELCQNINSRYVKRIMLTSHATKDVAVSAFNKGIIDMFLLKSDAKLVEKLADAINRCTNSFFEEISKLVHGYCCKMNLLNNINFIQFFTEFCQKNNIIEFCCIHDFNNLMLKDKEGKVRFLNIYSDGELNDLISTEQRSTAKDSIIKAIVEREMAPCFMDLQSPLTPDGSTWGELMVPLIKAGDDVFIAIN